MKRIVAPLGIVLTLAGCGSGPPPPVYGDAFKGLYNRSAASVPADVSVTLQHPVGIILNDNVEVYFQWVKSQREYWAGVVPASLTNDIANADADPAFVSGRVLEMLKRHFPEAQAVKDFPAAVAAGKKAVVLVDILPRIMTPGERTTKFDIVYYFFDSKMNPVSKMSGHGEQYRPFGAADGGIQYTVDPALAELDRKIASLLRS